MSGTSYRIIIQFGGQFPEPAGGSEGRWCDPDLGEEWRILLPPSALPQPNLRDSEDLGSMRLRAEGWWMFLLEQVAVTCIRR